MNMKNTWKQAILNLTVAASLVGFSHARETTGIRDGREVTDNELAYTINGDNTTLSVSGPNWLSDGWIGNLAIPEAVIVDSVKMPVTAIGERAFDVAATTTNRITGHVTIPKSVTVVGERAFYKNEITGISHEESIVSIGAAAFYECVNIAFFKIPGPVRVIQRDTFNGCASLSEIIFNLQTTNIGYQAFRDCSSLSSIRFPASLKSIDDDAFSGCGALKSIVVPGSVVSIGFGAFNPCVNLVSVTFDGTLPSVEHSSRSLRSFEDNNSRAITIVCRPNIGFEESFSDRSEYKIVYATPYAVFGKPNGGSIENGSRLNFGTVPAGSKGRVISVLVKNTGGKTLKLRKPGLTGSQRTSIAIVSKVPSSIAPGKSITLKIRFRPLAASGMKSTLSIRCNDPTKKTLRLRLVGKGA